MFDPKGMGFPSKPSFSDRVKSHVLFAILSDFFMFTQCSTEILEERAQECVRAQSGQAA